MIDTKNDVKSKLESSKNRLATAFNKLELLLDNFKNDFAVQLTIEQEITTLKEKLSTISLENKRLADNLKNLSEQYQSIKVVNQEVLEDLGGSITMIESLLVE